MRKIISLVTVLVMLFALAIPAMAHSEPPGDWRTSSAGMTRHVWVRGASPDFNAAIASGPQRLSGGPNTSWFLEVFPNYPNTNTNNQPFTVPDWQTFFTLNPGWELHNVSTSRGVRQPGQSFDLFENGNVGSMTYNFRRTNYRLRVETALQDASGNYTSITFINQTTGVGLVKDIIPNTMSFDTDEYHFEGWRVISGTGTIANPQEQNTTHTSGPDSAVVRAVFTRTPVTPPPPSTYTVTYDANFTSAPVAFTAPGSYEVGGTSHIVLAYGDIFDDGKDGYEFMGWSKSADGIVEYEAGNPLSMVNEGVTLYAVWQTAGPVDVLESNTVSIMLVAADENRLRDENGQLVHDGSGNHITVYDGSGNAVFRNTINIRVSVNGTALPSREIINNRRFSVDGEEFRLEFATMGNRLYGDGSVLDNAGNVGEARQRTLDNGRYQWQTHNYVDIESIRVIRVSDNTDVTEAFGLVSWSTPIRQADADAILVAAEDNTLFIRPGFLRIDFDPTPDPVEKELAISASNLRFVSVTPSNNVREYFVRFSIDFTYTDEDGIVVETATRSYTFSFNNNNANGNGTHVFPAGHDLYGLSIRFDIRGNGSNIRTFTLGGTLNNNTKAVTIGPDSDSASPAPALVGFTNVTRGALSSSGNVRTVNFTARANFDNGESELVSGAFRFTANNFNVTSAYTFGADANPLLVGHTIHFRLSGNGNNATLNIVLNG